MPTMTVHKLNTTGEVALTYEGELAEHLPGGVCLDARWTRDPLPLGYTTFETGDHFTEYYYTDRWYNIFEIASADGTLKGWYCNVAAPATISGTVIACRDLILDLWVAPDGTTRVLDEDEFADDKTLSTEERMQARAGLAALQALVARREHPFDGIHTPTDRVR